MMYDVFIIVTLPLLWIVLNIFSSITIWLYEMGHAIPALLFTKHPVNIYIGTYGDNAGNKFKAGRLTIYIKPKFAYLKQNGLCIYDTGMSFNRQLITLLGGPVIVLILLCVLVDQVCVSDVGLYTRIVLGFAMLIALLNFAINLFPRKLSVKSSVRSYYSDGYQLILIMEDKNNYSNIMTACHYYDERDYTNALHYLEKIDAKYMEESIFSLMLSCYIFLERFDLAKKLQKDHEDAKWQESVTADEYYLLGYADIKLADYSSALINFDKATGISPNHFNSRKSRAFVYAILKEYAMAKEEATKAIFINENSSAAFSTRAYANFMMGKSGEAFTDADKALSLDETNAYAHLVMGMYLLDKNKSEKALASFELAKQLDPQMLYIDDQLARIRPKAKPTATKKVTRKAKT